MVTTKENRILTNILLGVLLCFMYGHKSFSQHTYELYPDWGGIQHAGSAFVCVPGDSTFFLLGEVFDSLPFEDMTGRIGVAAELKFSGEEIRVNRFIDFDSIIPYIFTPYNSSVDEDGHILSRAVIFPDDFSRQDYFVKYDIQTNQIVRSFAVGSIDTGVFNTRLAYTNHLNSGGFIHAAAVAHYNAKQDLLLIETDSEFNELNRVTYRIKGSALAPDYVGKTESGYYEVVGTHFHYDVDGSVESTNLFYLALSDDGNDSQFKVLEMPSNFFIGNADGYYLIREGSGDFVMAPSNWVECGPSCLVTLPYILKISARFDTIRWQRKLFSIEEEDFPNVKLIIFSLISCSDSSGYVALGNQVNSVAWYEFPSSAFMYKLDTNGDSVWLNHYRPLSWESTYGGSIRFYDQMECPDGSFVLSGYARDTGTSQIRPYVLKVDSEGCLIPGCHQTTSSGSIPSGSETMFKVFPNPASSYLYLQCISEGSHDIDVRLISSDGREVRKTQFQAISKCQYILPLDGLPFGIYFIHITSADGRLIQTERVLIE